MGLCEILSVLQVDGQRNYPDKLIKVYSSDSLPGVGDIGLRGVCALGRGGGGT